MGRITLPGFIIVVVLFFVLAGFLSSLITVGGQTVTVPGLEAGPESLLDMLWSKVADWIGELF